MKFIPQTFLPSKFYKSKAHVEKQVGASRRIVDFRPPKIGEMFVPIRTSFIEEALTNFVEPRFIVESIESPTDWWE